MRPLTARTDSSRTPGSERRGDAGKRAQRFAYDWDEVGQLVRARRWDYAGNTIPAGEPVFPAVPTQAPDRDLRYAYSMGSRVLKSVADETSAETHTLEVFASLRVERTQLLGDDYELDENTEKVYLAGVGRLVHDPALPSWSGDPKHVFLTMSDHLGSAAFVLDRDSGEVVEKITHQAYGEVESDYRPTRWKSQREVYRFTGKEDDFEVGLTYFGARYFHARLGRWISPDPLTIHAGAADPNPYAYVGGRVSTATDPHGLDDVIVFPPDIIIGERPKPPADPPAPQGPKPGPPPAPHPDFPTCESCPDDPELVVLREAGRVAEPEPTTQSRMKEAALQGLGEVAALSLPSIVYVFGTTLASDDMNRQKAAHPEGFSSPTKGLLLSVEFVGAIAGFRAPRLSLPGAMNARQQVRIGGKVWQKLEPGDPACRTGCASAAMIIQRALGGGEIRGIRPPPGRNVMLGKVRNSSGEFVNPNPGAYGWYDHYVVVKEGRVYDALTGPQGLPIADYKSLWEYRDVLTFEF